MSQSKQNSGPRLTEIDGVRGILSIIVVAGHTAVAFAVPAFHGMQIWYWMPMDVFFTISGFLVGRIVVDNIQRPGFLRSYFARRILRIWPAYYSVVLVVSLCALLFGDRSADWSSTAFLKQITFLQFTEYLALAPRGEYLYGLLHTWSVAVEEHFYLALPLLAALLVRCRPWQIITVLMALSLVGIYLRLMLDMHFWVLPTRLHSFMMGLGLAYVVHWAAQSAQWNRILQSTGAVTLVGGFSLIWLFVSPVFPYELITGMPGRVRWLSQSLAAATFASFLMVAIYHANQPGRGGISVLRNRLLVHLGEISYSTYLWHWPVFIAIKPWVRAGEYSQYLVVPLSMLLVFVVANLSYYSVEKPFQRFKRFWAYSPERKLTTGGAAGRGIV